MFIDCHAHLSHCYEDDQLIPSAQTLSRKLAYLVNISLTIDEMRRASAISWASNIFQAFGLYPEEAPLFSKDRAREFLNIIEDATPKAIGEVGLDFYHSYGTLAQQEDLFRNQIETALANQLPLIIHSRDAFDDTVRILKSYAPNVPVIMHCFGYGPREAEEFLSLGFYLSFAGNLTYQKAHPLHEAALITPLDRILFETDSPYLSPSVVRGKPNFPENVEYTYRFFAERLRIPLDELCQRVKSNFEGIFLR